MSTQSLNWKNNPHVGNILFPFQSILHNGKMYSETVRGKSRGDSVRFQDSVGPSKETDSGLGYPETNATYMADGKELLGRVS